MKLKLPAGRSRRWVQFTGVPFMVGRFLLLLVCLPVAYGGNSSGLNDVLRSGYTLPMGGYFVPAASGALHGPFLYASGMSFEAKLAGELGGAGSDSNQRRRQFRRWPRSAALCGCLHTSFSAGCAHAAAANQVTRDGLAEAEGKLSRPARQKLDEYLARSAYSDEARMYFTVSEYVPRNGGRRRFAMRKCTVGVQQP
jgi:hypothetical protein